MTMLDILCLTREAKSQICLNLAPVDNQQMNVYTSDSNMFEKKGRLLSFHPAKSVLCDALWPGSIDSHCSHDTVNRVKR